MVDIGLTNSNVKSKCEISNIDLLKINVIFLTHAHIDHIKGLNVFLKNNPHISVYLTNETFEKLDKRYFENINFNFVKQNQKLMVNDINIQLFDTSHDSEGSFGLIFEFSNKKLVHITDTGYIKEANLKLFNNVNSILIESNYEDEMIMENIRYPFKTKQRIMSNSGHLSNVQCFDYLNEIVTNQCKYIQLAHLSENNNNGLELLKRYSDFSQEVKVLEKDEIIEVNYVW